MGSLIEHESFVFFLQRSHITDVKKSRFQLSIVLCNKYITKAYYPCEVEDVKQGNSRILRQVPYLS